MGVPRNFSSPWGWMRFAAGEAWNLPSEGQSGRRGWCSGTNTFKLGARALTCMDRHARHTSRLNHHRHHDNTQHTTHNSPRSTTTHKKHDTEKQDADRHRHRETRHRQTETDRDGQTNRRTDGRKTNSKKCKNIRKRLRTQLSDTSSEKRSVCQGMNRLKLWFST